MYVHVLGRVHEFQDVRGARGQLIMDVFGRLSGFGNFRHDGYLSRSSSTEDDQIHHSHTITTILEAQASAFAAGGICANLPWYQVFTSRVARIVGPENA